LRDYCISFAEIDIYGGAIPSVKRNSVVDDVVAGQSNFCKFDIGHGWQVKWACGDGHIGIMFANNNEIVLPV